MFADKRRPPARGFTLLEVMVALAIFAIAGLALLKAQNSQITTDQQLQDKTFAHWVALNRLAELRLNKTFPEIGQGDTTALMAGREWLVSTKVQATPSANVRLVIVSVAEKATEFGEKNSPLTQLTGFLPKVSGNETPAQ